MNKTHWKKLHNPDYLGAYSLDPGKDKILTIKEVRNEIITGADGKKEECTVVRFMEPEKPMILNVTNSKTINKIYKTPYIEEWAGKKIQLYAASIKAFGETMEALRIRNIVPENTELICSDCNNQIKKYKELTPEQLAKATKSKYGMSLCSDCSKIRKEKLEQEKIDEIIKDETTEDETNLIKTDEDGVIINADK